jgi:hypothetical protein
MSVLQEFDVRRFTIRADPPGVRFSGRIEIADPDPEQAMSDSAIADREPLPPDETFWKRYSPRHECPIAGSASTLVHLVALGGVVLAGLAMSWRWYGDKVQPPAMSVVYVEGNGGDGRQPGGGGGAPKNGGTEDVEVRSQPKQPSVTAPKPQNPVVLVPRQLPGDDPDFVVPMPAPTTDVDKAFAKAQEDDAKAAAANAKSSGAKSTGLGGPGDGGGLGTGKGTGVGPGNGPGDGTGPAGATTKSIRAQILANRWHFDSGGSPRERIAKFAAVGITLGFTDFTGNLYIIEDMKRRPVKFHVDSFDRYKDIVKWANNKDDPALPGLARELGLPLTLAQLVLLLPPDREQKMADEEMRYAREKGYDFSKVEGTLFDFVLMQGVYEPVVKGQAPFDKSVPIGKGRGR